MAEWKKVIVSGSSAELSSLTLDTGLANTELANDGITIAGQDISLGGSITADTILDGATDTLISASVLSSATQGTAVLTTNGVAGSTVDLGLETTDNVTFNKITATDVISSSAKVISDGIDLSDRITFVNGNTNNTIGALNPNELNFAGSDVVRFAPNVALDSHLTASGNISSSGTITANALSLDTALSVANGGTNATSFADKSVIISQDSGTDTLSAAPMTGDGELLIGGASGPTVATLTNGNGIDISDGDGSITLAIDGTDAVTFSNDASIFSGSFSGSFEGDGSNLTGVSATSFDFDGLSGTGVDNTSVEDADLFAFSDSTTEKKITYAQLYGNIFGEVDTDATIAVGGALTISDDAVTNAKLANMAQGTVKVGGALDAPTDLDASTSGQILVGDGTDINSVAVSGDATLASDGALTLKSGIVSASAITSPSQGTLTVNGASVDLGLQTGDSPQFTNLTITNDLTVQGTTTSLETTNLTIEDQFITIASGSQSPTDGGLIVSKQADGAGFAFGYDTVTTRWVLDADLAVDATGIVADAYLATVEVSAAAPSSDPVYGGSGNGYGNMHVKTDTGDIYIYA